MASFPYFNGTGSVYVCIRKINRRNDEARAHIECVQGFIMLTCTEPVLEIRKTRHEISVNIGIFLQCAANCGLDGLDHHSVTLGLACSRQMCTVMLKVCYVN